MLLGICYCLRLELTWVTGSLGQMGKSCCPQMFGKREPAWLHLDASLPSDPNTVTSWAPVAYRLILTFLGQHLTEPRRVRAAVTEGYTKKTTVGLLLHDPAETL